MNATGPLSGIRVLELGALGPAPFCGALLADLGADVVRVDRLATSDLGVETPPRFDFYNRNKRSIALDLKHPEGVAAAMALAMRADILIEGFRPGVAERLGLGPLECRPGNPKLVYGRMTGWGQTGPMAQLAGHDINYIALSGALHAIGPGEGRPAVPLNLIGDLGGGAMYLAVGVLAAHVEAQRSGQGQVVDAAMVDGVSNLLSLMHGFMQAGMWQDGRESNLTDGGAPYYGTYKTRDGKYVAVGAIEARFYAELLKGMGLDAAQLPDRNDRAAWPAMRQRFAEVFVTRTRDEWVHAMRERDACFSPVLTLTEAPQHPQLRERDSFVQLDGAMHPAPAPRFERTPASLRRGAPRPGEHSLEVMRDWGLHADQAERLLRDGVAGQ
ncbi:MAG TPA: CaiB/BaiF CoA-transferase family protein [Ramlibacter sp.]|nr:CaiB/BaiF CoA-transferase family protein [Ramlibacter sp.]